jgi:hypothetical protein
VSRLPFPHYSARHCRGPRTAPIRFADNQSAPPNNCANWARDVIPSLAPSAACSTRAQTGITGRGRPARSADHLITRVILIHGW